MQLTLECLEISVEIVKIPDINNGQNEIRTIKPSKFLRKISIKSYCHLAQKGAKSLLAALLFSGIGTPDHGHDWSFEYYDKKFALSPDPVAENEDFSPIPSFWTQITLRTIFFRSRVLLSWNSFYRSHYINCKMNCKNIIHVKIVRLYRTE